MDTERTIPAEQSRREIAAMKNNSSRQEVSIDLAKLVQFYLSKWYVLLMWLLVGMVVANLFAFFCVTPQYTSEAKLYVVSASGDSVVDLTDLNIGTSLTNDYKELLFSYPVLDSVIESLELDIKREDLVKLITLANPSNTRVLTITAKTVDPQLSANIVNTMAAVAQKYLPETMGTLKPNVAQVGVVAETRSEPSYTKYTAIGGILTELCVLAYYTVIFIQVDTVKTAQDVEEEFGMAPLTCMPTIKEMDYNDHLNIHPVKKGLRKFIRKG